MRSKVIETTLFFHPRMKLFNFLDDTTYTMPLQHASDLSPAQRLLLEISDRSCSPDPTSITTREHQKRICHEHALKRLFSLALHWCVQNTEASSWQRRRLYALIGPMYLEAAAILSQDSPPHELLIDYPTWTEQSILPCAICHQALTQSLVELKELLAEMITEVNID